MTRDDLVVHLAQFAAALREGGLTVGIGDEVDAARALTLIDLFDPEEVHRALRIAFKVRRRDWATFDASFARFWAAAPAGVRAVESTRGPKPSADVVRRSGLQSGTEGGGRDQSFGAGDTPGYSPDVVLRRKPFDECSADDLAEMERVLARLTLKLAFGRSRRLVPARRRGIADLRRSFRRALGTGGELVALAYRGRAIETPRLVVLCDTSGSMDRHVRFLLAFVLALRRIARGTEVFVFNTSLTRVTPSLAAGRIDRIGPMLDGLAAAVPDWSGGTRIGESLTEFVARYRDQFVTGKSVVIIFSDGLDRGDTTLVATAVRAIRARARKIIWLNPLAGDPRYEPTARAMQAALPFVDRLAPAHNLESLERLLPELAA